MLQGRVSPFLKFEHRQHYRRALACFTIAANLLTPSEEMPDESLAQILKVDIDRVLDKAFELAEVCRRPWTEPCQRGAPL